jgi:hypothetical protein
VGAEADDRGLGLNRTGGEEDLLATPWVCPFPAQWPARALDPVDGRAGEISSFDLAGQAIGGMEIGRGEELRPADRVGVTVLAVRQVLVDDRPEVRIVQPALVQPVEQ